MSKIQTTIVGESKMSEEDRYELRKEDIKVLAANGKNLSNIDLICGETNLRWLDLRGNVIKDQALKSLENLKVLEVLLLDNNLLESAGSLIDPLKQHAHLRVLSLSGNPVLKSEQNLKLLKTHFPGDSLLIEPINPTILQLRKKCIVLEIKQEQKDSQIKSLRRQIFESKSHSIINLKKYLIELKENCKTDGQMIHTLFLTLKRLERQNSEEIRKTYPNLPWHIIMQWPDNNFIVENKLNCQQVQKIVENEQIEHSTNLEYHLENLLNQYYELHFNNLFKVCKAKLSYVNLNKLLEFLLSNCKNYFLRESEKYEGWIKASFPFPINIKQQLIKYFIEQDISKLSLLESILNKAEDAKHTKQQKHFLNQVKKISFKKVLQVTIKQPSNKPFPRLIMQFFTDILDLYTDGVQIITQNKQQNILFAKFLFRQFDSSDIYYLSLLLKQGEMRNQEYFLSNITTLGEIVSVKLWIDSIQQEENKLKNIDSKEINLALSVFLKKILGRPEFNIQTLKKYFPKFDFNVIQRIIDCHQRPQIIQLLNNRFDKDFSFIRQSIISGKQHEKFAEMKDILNQNKLLNKQQKQFVQNITFMFAQIQLSICKNPLFNKIINQIPTSFSLLQSILSVQPNSLSVDQIIQTTNQDKLYSLQNRYLLEMMRSVIRVDNKNIQLVNRDECWFSNNLDSMKSAKFYQKYQYLFNFIRFSYTLYLQHLQEESPSIPHKNILNSQQISKTNNLKVYLQKINNKYLLSDYLLDICRQEVRNLVFVVQQGVLTFQMLKFRELAKNPTCKYCFDEDFYEELELISNTNGIYYVQIHQYDQSKFNDKQLRQALLQSYHQEILLHCLKKELMNLGEFSLLLEKAEKLAKVKGFQLKLPLYDISKIVRTEMFQKSQFKVQLFKFLRNKVRSETDRKNLITLFNALTKKLKEKETIDNRKFQFVKEMFSIEQDKECETFISNIPLICSIQFKAKVYSILDWNLLDSFATTNYLAYWKQNGIGQIQERMTKYKRVLYRYLSNPTGFKGQRQSLNRSTDKFEDLILIQQINSMLKFLLPTGQNQKKGLTLTFHLIHLCLKKLEEKGDIDEVQNFNYQICLSIKKKLNHRGFLILTQYLLNGINSQNKQDIEEILESINYKIQYYKSINILKRLLIEREYNPMNYFNGLIKILTTLSNINILNTEIEIQLIRNRYPKFPWSFIVMISVLEPNNLWYKLLITLQQQYGLYLQLLHYLDTRDETDGIIILKLFFQIVYSSICCNDIIKRIIGIMEVSKQLRVVADKLLVFSQDSIKTVDQNEIVLLIEKESKLDFKVWGNNELLSYLRILSLKGQYLNRIEKSSNRLRNMLCDYDEQGVDINYFLKSHSTKQTQLNFRLSLLQTLKISLKYKYSLFNTNYNTFYQPLKSPTLDKNNPKLIIQYLSTFNYKKQFINFKQPDLHLHFVLLSQPEVIQKYWKDLVVLYRLTINNLDRNNNKISQWQAAEFLHVAILTTIRLKNKYRIVAEISQSIEEELDKQPYKVYRNHLAHYIPSQRMLAAKKLKVENSSEVHILNERIDKTIRRFKI